MTVHPDLNLDIARQQRVTRQAQASRFHVLRARRAHSATRDRRSGPTAARVSAPPGPAA